ncbi:MAG: hypothetical protein AAFX99_32835 [Myxococcota bacterium]
MTMTVALVLALGLVMAMVAVGAALEGHVVRAMTQTWREVAQMHGLRLEAGRGGIFPTPGQVVGEYRGYAVALCRRDRVDAMQAEALGERRDRCWVVTTTLKSELPVRLWVTRALGASVAGIWDKGVSVAVGDRAFDEAFHVTGEGDEEEVRRVLSWPVREALLTLNRGPYVVWVTPEEVSVAFAAALDADAVHGILEAQHTVADALCRRGAELVLEECREPAVAVAMR